MHSEVFVLQSGRVTEDCGEVETTGADWLHEGKSSECCEHTDVTRPLIPNDARRSFLRVDCVKMQVNWLLTGGFRLESSLFKDCEHTIGEDTLNRPGFHECHRARHRRAWCLLCEPGLR